MLKNFGKVSQDALTRKIKSGIQPISGIPSNRKSLFFIEMPDEYPPRPPSEHTTRWQGTMGGTGFTPTALPTALEAFVLPISPATHL